MKRKMTIARVKTFIFVTVLCQLSSHRFKLSFLVTENIHRLQLSFQIAVDVTCLYVKYESS